LKELNTLTYFKKGPCTVLKGILETKKC